MYLKPNEILTCFGATDNVLTAAQEYADSHFPTASKNLVISFAKLVSYLSGKGDTLDTDFAQSQILRLFAAAATCLVSPLPAQDILTILERYYFYNDQESAVDYLIACLPPKSVPRLVLELSRPPEEQRRSPGRSKKE